MKRALLLVALLLSATPLLAVEDPSTARGFSPERVYDFGDPDSVNLFNGNLVVRIGIGQRYTVSPQLSYGLTLAYNSKVWDNVATGSPFEYCGSQEGMTAIPRFTSNAGMGWSLGFGRLFPQSDANGTSQFLYESPDGAAHVFERQIQSHQQGNPGSTAVYLTSDNSHLRLTITGWTAAQYPYPFDRPNAATLELPDGTRQFYVAGQAQTYDDWSLTSIKDRFENTISVIWSPSGLDETLTDPFGRQTVIHYQTVHAQTQVYRKVVTSVVVPIFPDPVSGQTSATYLFSYNWARVIDPVQYNLCDPPYLDDVPLLASVTLPDGTSFLMDHPQYQTASFGTVREAELRTLTLPTRGRLVYDYGAYSLPGATCAVKAPAQGGISVRSYVDPFGNTQQWAYTQTLGDYSYSANQCDSTNAPSQGLEEPYDLSTTTVTTPSGAKEVHYFSVFQGGWIFTPNAAVSPHGFRADEYGLSVTHLAAGFGGELLSEQIYDCSSGTCPPTPDHSTYVQYEDHGGGAPNFVDLLPKASRTLFHGDLVDGTARYSETVNEDYDGYGHYRKSTTYGNFTGNDVRTTYTNFNPGTDANGTINGADPFAGRSWILGMYADQWVGELSHTAKTESFFETNTGFLLRRRTLLGDGATAANVSRNSHDLLVTFEHDSAGNVTKQKDFGGDTCGSSTLLNGCGSSVSCATLDPIDASSVIPVNAVPAYETHQASTHGAPSLTQAIQCNGLPMPFDTFRATVDLSGAVSETFGTDGLSTHYAYDALGRITSVAPPGESPLQVVYTPATVFGNNPATATATRGTTETRYQYDGLGRLRKEMRQMPGGVWSLRERTYDTVGQLQTQSGFEKTTTGFAFTPLFHTTYAYDAFNRPLSITAPDGHFTSLAYQGISQRSETVSIATGVAETPVTTKQTFDRQGHLTSVIEAEGTPAAVTTTYGYDVGGRLASVLMGAEQQQRYFSYDNRGFLLVETHPELGAGGNASVSYSDYDARGHARRKSFPFGADTRITLDPAERVLKVFDVAAQRDLKLFQYDSGAQCAGATCLGKLSAAARFHYDPDLGAVAVTESYQYSSVHGHPTRRDRTIGTTATFTGAGFYFTESYDDLGHVASIGYPCRGVSTPCEDSFHVPRTVSYGYTNGLLTNIGSWGLISYQPNGLVDTIRHNIPQYAVTETWTADPWQIARPARITNTDASGNVLWTSGDYDYDGAGNVRSIDTTSYVYDAFNRLARWTTTSAGSTQGSAVTYDTFGNQLATQLSFCSTNPDGSRRCGGTAYQPMVIAGTTNHYVGHTYDAAGNVLSDGSRTFTYDPLNVTTRTQASGRDFRFLYTVDDERIAAVEMLPGGGKRTTCTIRGFNNELLSEWTDGQWKEDEIWRGSQLLATETPSGTVNQHLDHLGSPRLKTSAFGAVLGTQSFAPFGAGGTSNGGALQFTAHERDAANLGGGTADLPDYMHARYYSAGVGRFLSVDPVLPSKAALGHSQTWNRYSYGGNNPLRITDPDGRDGVDALFVPPTAWQPADRDGRGVLFGAMGATAVWGAMEGAVGFGGLELAFASRFPLTYLTLMEIGVAATSGVSSSRSVSLDTNAVIAAIEGGPAEVAAVAKAMNGRAPVVSTVVVEEFAKKGNVTALADFLRTSGGTVVKSASAAIVQQLEARGLKPADAQAAATAVESGTKFITRDREILTKIPEIAQRF